MLYVLPFYLSKTTRPSPTLTRDAPTVIRARIRAVILSCLICSAFTLFLIIVKAEATPKEAFQLLGWWPIGLFEIGKSLLLTSILFAGPLFEKGAVDGEWRDWIRVRGLREELSSWFGYRNYVIVSHLQLPLSTSSFPLPPPIYLPPLTQHSHPPGPNNRRAPLPLPPDLPAPTHLTLAPVLSPHIPPRAPPPTILRHRAHPPLLRVHINPSPHASNRRLPPLPLPIQLHHRFRLVRFLALLTNRQSMGRHPRPRRLQLDRFTPTMGQIGRSSR